MNIRPLHDRVVVKRIEQGEQVRGGIIIPDTAKEKPQEAEVVAVGPGKLNDEGKRMPIDVKTGLSDGTITELIRSSQCTSLTSFSRCALTLFS